MTLYSSMITIFITSPFENIHTILSADMAHGKLRRFRGTFDTGRYIMLSYHPRMLWQGYTLGVIHLGLFQWQFWKWYPKLLLNINDGRPTFIQRYITSTIVSLSLLSLFYPIDTVRRRMMVQYLSKTKHYHTAYDVSLYSCSIYYDIEYIMI